MACTTVAPMLADMLKNLLSESLELFVAEYKANLHL